MVRYQVVIYTEKKYRESFSLFRLVAVHILKSLRGLMEADGGSEAVQVWVSNPEKTIHDIDSYKGCVKAEVSNRGSGRHCRGHMVKCL